MDVSARVSSRGQITIPRAAREALSIREGDEVLFRVEGQSAMIARSPDLLQLAGSVSVPAPKRGTPWDNERPWAVTPISATHRFTLHPHERRIAYSARPVPPVRYNDDRQPRA